MKVIHVQKIGYEYRLSVVTEGETGGEISRCSGRPELIDALTQRGVPPEGISKVFKQLEDSTDAEWHLS